MAKGFAAPLESKLHERANWGAPVLITTKKGRQAMNLKQLLSLMLMLSLAVGAHASDVDNYQGSWIDRALSMQRDLGDFTPLGQATFLGTHNSYNSAAYSSAVRYVDPNQSRSIRDQLRMDVRALEFDLHTYFSMQGWFWDWGKELLLCHGQDNHAGCSSYDRTFSQGLREIRDWLDQPENRDEVILLYLEDHIDGGWYDDAITDLDHYLGDGIYRPEGSGCQGIPMDQSRSEILARGKQVILVTDGCANGFSSWVHGGVGDYTHGYPTTSVEDLGGYPHCATDQFNRAFQDQHILRINEDRTNLSNTFSDPGEPITPAALRTMMQCGINLAGMDKLTPWDGRLKAAVWSWNRGEPNNAGSGEDCAEHLFSGRFNDASCSTQRRFACKKPGSHDWYITADAGSWSEGEQLCRNETNGSHRFSVPTHGFDNEKLKEAKAYHGSVGKVWLNYSDRMNEGEWVPGNPR